MPKYFITKETYQAKIFQEEPGGIQDADMVSIGKPQNILSGDYDGDLKDLTAEMLGFDNYHYPSGDEDGAVMVGDWSYSYAITDAEGRFIKSLHPFESPMRTTYAEDDQDWEVDDWWDDPVEVGMTDEELESWEAFAAGFIAEAEAEANNPTS